jgi:hypothetical protein
MVGPANHLLPGAVGEEDRRRGDVAVGGGDGANEPARRRGAHPEGPVRERERGAAVEEQEGGWRHRGGVGQVGVGVASGRGGSGFFLPAAGARWLTGW